MHDYRDDIPDGDFPYARPSLSAWVAVVAVALAFFVIGGFVKNYRQMENLREESRREIRDLRAQIETLRPHAVPAAGSAVPAGREAAPPRMTSLPPARPRLRQPPAPVPPRTQIPEIDGRETGVTYVIGRRSQSGKTEAGRPGIVGLEVVVVNNGQKRVMVEGGEDAGFSVGSRLELSRQGRWIGDLRVTEVFAAMSACEVLHATQTPEPGDSVRLP